MPNTTPSGQPLPQQPGEWKPSAPANAVTFKITDIGPPSPLYIQRDDVLVVQVMTSNNNETVTINWRLLLPNGVIIPGQRQIPLLASSFTLVTLRIDLAEGFLLNVSASCATSSIRGQLFVRCSLNRGGVAATNILGQLFADYVTNTAANGWPFGRIVSPTEGPGQLVVQTIANPGAGNEWNFTSPNLSRVRLQSLMATLTTSATVASRLPRLQVSPGGGVPTFWCTPNQGVPASTTARVAAAGATMSASPAGMPDVQITLPAPTMLQAASVVNTATLNLQVGDAYTTIAAHYEQWFDF